MKITSLLTMKTTDQQQAIIKCLELNGYKLQADGRYVRVDLVTGMTTRTTLTEDGVVCEIRDNDGIIEKGLWTVRNSAPYSQITIEDDFIVFNLKE